MKHLFSEPLEQITDLAVSISGLTIKFPVWLTALIGGMGLGVIFDWIHKSVGLYVWSPPMTYYTIVLCVLFNGITGVILADKQNRLKLNKILNFLWEGLSYTGILILANAWGKSERTLSWLPEAIIVPICLLLIIKLLRNLSALGVLDKRLYVYLSKKVEEKEPELKEEADTPEKNN